MQASSFGDGKEISGECIYKLYFFKGKLTLPGLQSTPYQSCWQLLLPKNEVYAVDIRMHENFLYGYDTALYKYTRKDVRQQFQDFAVKAGIRNTITGEYGINYNPSLLVSNFTNVNKLVETSDCFCSGGKAVR